MTEPKLICSNCNKEIKKTNSAFKPLPNYELAPLRKCNRDLFATDDPSLKKLHGFILSLGLIFNDLKGIIWVSDLLTEGKQLDDAISAYCGQWGGMKSQMLRVGYGIINELLQLIEKNKRCLEHPRFILCLEYLGSDIRKSWQEISDCAVNNPEKSELRKFLHTVRNEAAFHYYQTEHLMNGYELWRKAEGEHSRYACFSFGANMESTRFYLSDAASQFHLQERLRKHNIANGQIKQFLQSINEVLRFIVETYIVKVLKVQKVVTQLK